MIDFFEGITKEQVGKYLKRERLARGYSIKDFSKVIEVSSSTISTWEMGKIAPNEENLKKLLHFYRDNAPMPRFELELELRKRHWWPEKLAKLVGVSTETIYNWIRREGINLNYAKKVAQVFADEPRQKYDLEYLRHKLCLSLEEVAEYMRVKPKTLRSWERCCTRPTPEELDKLLAYYKEKEPQTPVVAA